MPYKDRKKERAFQKQYHKEYFEKNKEKIYAKQKEYKEKNKQKVAEYLKDYRQKNKERINIQVIRKYSNDIQFKLKVLLSNRVRKSLKNQNILKKTKTVKLIGCSWQEARDHLQSQFKEGMTWENHGKYGWHIDHIIPCSSFDLTDPEQQKKCFHYTNIQPLWWHENLSKGNKILS